MEAITSHKVCLETHNSTHTLFVQPVVIDLRDEHSFKNAHHPYATHFDGVEDLSARLAELPEPTIRAQLHVQFVPSRAEAIRAAAGILMKLGFKSVSVCTPNPKEFSATGSFSRRLWSPSSLTVVAESVSRKLNHTAPKTAIDLGCGGGRDVAWLSSRGWTVLGVDRSAELVARTEKLSRRCFVDGAGNNNGNSNLGKVSTERRTFGAHSSEDREWLRKNDASLVIVVRFLRRPLLYQLGAAVEENGIIAYEHFLDGCEAFGSPKNKAQMLRYGELAKLFSPENGFRIILDQVHHLADGRPVSRFVAQRRGTEKYPEDKSS